MQSEIIQKLLQSNEPSIRYDTLINILGNHPETAECLTLHRQIKNSQRVKTLLSERDKSGEIPYHPYKKWSGAHWVLAILSELSYPSGDKSLNPLKYQVYDWLSSKKHQDSIKVINGRVRRCASQEGYALYYLLKLGIDDEQTDELASRLAAWQWPDGGWNCDKNPHAGISSFIESLIPMRALFLHAKFKNNDISRQAAIKASQIFLKRRLFLSLRTGSVMKKEFVKLHYPRYYYYDILFALKVMAENELIADERCNDALDLLESMALPDGGFPAQAKLYIRATTGRASRGSLVVWGSSGKRHYNEWVTSDALYVLKKAGRLN